MGRMEKQAMSDKISSSKQIRSIFIILFYSIVLFLTIGNVYADFDINRWEYYKQVNISDNTASKYAEVLIDKDVYCNSQAFPSDLRIISDRNIEIPYVLITKASKTDEMASYTPQILNKSIVSGKYGILILDMGKSGQINNRMTLDTSSQNFMYRVEISGSQDQQQWAILKQDAYIFNFSRDYYAQKTDISYPENTYRYLQVKIFNHNEPPLKVSSVSVNYQKTLPAVEDIVYQGKGEITQNKTNRSTDIIIDFKCKGVPSERAHIDSTDTNYYRRVSISVSNDLVNWNPLMGNGYILKYNTPTFAGEESNITYNSDTLNRYLKFSIENYDNPPINISQITIYAYQQKVFFITDGSSTYRLYYGNREAVQPVYDTQEIMRYVPSHKVVTLKLGPSVKNPQFSLPVFSEVWMERNSWVLWSILIISIVLIAIFSIRLIKKTGNISDHS